MGVTPSSSLHWAHAPDPIPPSSGRPSVRRSWQVAASPCGNVVLPDVPLHSFPSVLGPLPRGLVWCLCPFLPTCHRPSPRSDRIGAPPSPFPRLQEGRPLRGCRPSLMCRPAGLLTTPIAPPATAHHRRAAVVAPSAPRIGSLS